MIKEKHAMSKQTQSRWQSMNPDLVIINAKIVTGDDDFLIAEALAIKDTRIFGVGSDVDMKKLAGKNTEILDLKGATVLPGINDAHCHLNGFGLERPPMIVDLRYPSIKSLTKTEQDGKEYFYDGPGINVIPKSTDK